MTLDALLALSRSRGLRIPPEVLRHWLRELEGRGWLVKRGEDDWELTPRGHSHLWGLHQADPSDYGSSPAPVGAFHRRERRVEEDA